MLPRASWERWFQPAIQLINRLKYPQKFVLLSFVLLLPLGLALYLLLSEIQGQINFAAKELEGLHYLQALERFQQAVLSLPSQGSAIHTNAEHLAAWQDLKQAEQTWGPRLKTEARFQALAQYWPQSTSAPLAKGPLLTALARLRIQVGDQSNLILDPDLDSYYLMDAILLRLPGIQADLAAVADLLPVKELSPLQRAQLVVWGERIEQANQALQTYAIVAFEHNRDGQLRPRLEDPLQAFGEELDPVTQPLARLADPEETPSLPDLERQAQQALQSSFPLWQKTSTELERLLQKRIQRFRYRQWSLSLFVLFTLAMALYLFIGFYRSVMQTVESLSQAARRMVDGTQTQGVQLQTQDEMAMVIHSFNTVADALRLAEAKYRSIVENAVEGIYQTTVTGQYLMANPMLAQIYGYDSPADLIQHFSNIETQLYVNPERRQDFIQCMLAQGKVWGFESEVYRKNSETIWISESARAIYDHQGQLLGFEGTVVDVTRRKQDEEEIARLTQQLQDENLRMSAELSVTRRLQSMLMPSEEELSRVADLDIAGFIEPAAEVGGDYYDIQQAHGRVRISIGDVTGHGLESSLVMIMAQTAVRTLLANGETDPARLLNAVNQTIYENTRRMGSYKNMTLALLEYEAGLLRLSGQHEELIIVRANGEAEQIDTFDLGFPLGLELDISRFVAEAQIQFFPGDIAVLYTDGITEAMNPAKEQYGLARIQKVVVAHRQQSAAEIRQALIDDLKAWIHTQRVFDDITLLVLKQL